MKLLIVEDDSIMAQTLASSLKNFGLKEIQVVKSASEAMRIFRIFQPNVCLVDIDLRVGPTGVDLSYAMRRLNPNIGLVFLTSVSDPRLVDSKIPELPENSLYLIKNAVKNIEEVAEALKLTSNGKSFLKDPLKKYPFLDLSKTQFELIRLIALGHSNTEISRIRVTTIKSTENSIARLAKKLDIPNTSSASQRVLIARRYSLLTGKL